MHGHDSRMEQQEHTSDNWVQTLRSIRRWVIWLAILGRVDAMRQLFGTAESRGWSVGRRWDVAVQSTPPATQTDHE